MYARRFDHQAALKTEASGKALLQGARKDARSALDLTGTGWGTSVHQSSINYANWVFRSGKVGLSYERVAGNNAAAGAVDHEVFVNLVAAAFADLPRGAIPTEAFYLPLNENWPMDHEKSFRGGYWIEQAYDPAYWKEFGAAARGFAAHFSQRGWKETTFEFYLNNKVYFKNGKNGKPGSWRTTTAPWVFDEPQHTQDFWALRRFGREFGEATTTFGDVRMAFRLDISRPEWQRDLLDGIAQVAVVSGTLRDYPRRVIGRARRDGQQVYMYGSPSKLGQPLAINAAWCAETWALGADGVVPWQTLGKPDALTKPDDLAVLYPGPQGPLPSLRLKAFRAGQQLAWVGPHFQSAYKACKLASSMARGCQPLWVRALRKS